MSNYYRGKRTRGIFDPKSSEPFKISRSRLDTFLNCSRCFYLDRRLGIDKPPGYPFALNSAVDKLLKMEFDQYRESGHPHPLMLENGVDAIPFKHERLEEWRDSLRRGVQYHHKPSNLILAGGVDDIWANPCGELIVVDYKATSKDAEITLDADWQIGYKRQMEVYQWLFRRNGFKVNPKGYFVYCNGLTNRNYFGGRLDFEIKLIPYNGDDSWIDGALVAAGQCLLGDQPSQANSDCDYCRYVSLQAALGGNGRSYNK